SPGQASLPARFGADIRTEPVTSGLGRVAQRESTSLTSRGSQVRSLSRPPSSLPEPRKPSSIEKTPFLRGSRHLFSTFPVSGDISCLTGGFLASGLCIQKFRSRRLN